MPPPVTEAGRITLRPFRETDIAWVCEVSQDPVIPGHLPEVCAPYRFEHAAYFVRPMTLAAWDDGRRAEFLIEDAGAARLGRATPRSHARHRSHSTAPSGAQAGVAGRHSGFAPGGPDLSLGWKPSPARRRR